MKKIYIITLTILIAFLSAGSVQAEHEIAYDSFLDRVIHAESTGPDSAGNYTISVVVTDTDNNAIDPTDQGPIEAATDSAGPSFGLAYDRATFTAYICYEDTNGAEAMVKVDLTPSTPPPTPAEISVSPPSLAFSDTDVGSKAPAKDVTVSNIGESPLTVTGVTGPGSADFGITSNNCTTLNQGENCTVSVEFKPQSAGDKTDSITIISDGGNAQVGLSGKGVEQQQGFVDLVLDQFTMAATSITHRSRVPTTYVITNTGNQDSGPFKVRLRAVEKWQTWKKTYFTESIANIPAGQTITKQLSLDVGYIPLHVTLDFTLHVDYQNAVKESNEQNNKKTISMPTQ
jgi:hypothetical protein